MTWRDNLQLEGRGSFRGVEFFVESADSVVGRRTVVHEFPGSDEVVVEDLGRATRRFTLTAYVLGPDYMTARDKLRDAFEKPGPGPLVHPWWGEFVVAVESPPRIREDFENGGMARFTLEVVRIAEDTIRTVRPDTAAILASAANVAADAIEEDFADAWTVTGVIEAVRDAAQDLIDGTNGAASVLNKASGYASTVMGIADAAGDAVSSLIENAAAIVLLPATLSATIRSTLNSVIGSFTSIGGTWDRYFGPDGEVASVAGTPLSSPTGITPASGDRRAEAAMVNLRDTASYGSGFDTVVETTPQREAQAENQAAMVRMFRGLAIVETARIVGDLPFVSRTQAIAIRDEISVLLDSLTDDANDVTYAALVDLRTATHDHLNQAADDLPAVVSYTPKVQMPALVIAQVLYGDATRDAEIVDRNRIRNPARVPSGEALEVLSVA